MLSIVVLGAAAGGGVPQWNCGCDNCRAAWDGPSQLRLTQASIAFSADNQNWFLVNASPDIRQQIISTPQLHPKHGQLRHSPITGVILTNGEVDAVAGLLNLREGYPYTVFGHQRVLDILDSNSIFNVLSREKVRRQPISSDVSFEPTNADGTPSGLVITAFTVPGKPAWYLEEIAEKDEGDTIALEIENKADGKCFYFIPACAEITPDIKNRISGADLVFFDGTLWQDDEMIVNGLAQKTGQRMGHTSMSDPFGPIAQLADLGIENKVFIHINNSNPALALHSPERAQALAAGWIIPHDGMEFTL